MRPRPPICAGSPFDTLEARHQTGCHVASCDITGSCVGPSLRRSLGLAGRHLTVQEQLVEEGNRLSLATTQALGHSPSGRFSVSTAQTLFAGGPLQHMDRRAVNWQMAPPSLRAVPPRLQEYPAHSVQSADTEGTAWIPNSCSVPETGQSLSGKAIPKRWRNCLR